MTLQSQICQSGRSDKGLGAKQQLNQCPEPEQNDAVEKHFGDGAAKAPG